MKMFEVSLPARDGQAARVIAVAFTHPWKEVDCRGSKQVMKVTNCAIGEKMDRTTKDGKACYRFYGFAQAKWPLVAPKENGVILKGWSHCTLPGERLSKTNGSREALRRVLASCRSAFTYTERALIWKEFHRVMKTGVVPDDNPIQPMLHPVATTVQPAASPAGVMLMTMPAGAWRMSSKYVH